MCLTYEGKDYGWKFRLMDYVWILMAYENVERKSVWHIGSLRAFRAHEKYVVLEAVF